MATLERLIQERDIVGKEVESRLPDDPDAELLTSIPGIGLQMGVQLMSVIADIDCFKDADKLCAYFGLVPRVRDSRDKKHHIKMMKNGDK